MSGALTHSPAEIIRQLIIDLGFGVNSTTEDWSVFSYTEPNTPDNAITVYSTAGRKQGAFMVNGQTQMFSGIQVRIRGNDKRETFAKSSALANGFDGVQQKNVRVETSDYVIAATRITGDPIDLGNEVPKSKRRIFVINLTAAMHQN